MLRRHSIILSFVLATLLAAGGVELFYRSLSQTLTGRKEVVQTKAGKTAVTGSKKVASADTTAPLQLKETAVPENKKDYAIITKRNLFGKVKEKTVVKPPEPKPEPIMTATALDLVLLGTISGTENEARAFIQAKVKGKQKQDIYYKGDAIQAARIKEINRGQIILTVNGKDEVLLMNESKSPKWTANSRSNTPDEVYSLADVMEKEEKQSKKAPRKRSPAKKDNTLQLEKKLGN
ncbi:MAG: hypothetical protein K9K37_04580 [Desulfocapsa sp.]|nr:hypothetical protein [Desulfocapsa sp.]